MARAVGRFNSLRFKFALALALFSSILMVAVMLLLEQRLRETLVRESIDKGIGVARGLAFNAEDPLLTGDDLTLFSAVKNAVRAPGVIYTVILDRDQVIRADTVFERIGSRYQPPTASRVVHDSTDYRVLRIARADGADLLDLEVPILTVADPPLTIGAIHVGLSEELIVADIRRMRLHLAGLAALALILGGLGAAVLAGMMVGPLAALVRGVRAIGEGDLDQHITMQRSDDTS